VSKAQWMPEGACVLDGLTAHLDGLIDAAQGPEDARAVRQGGHLRIPPVDQRGPTMLHGRVEGLALVEVTKRSRELAAEVMHRPQPVVRDEAHQPVTVRLGDHPVALTELEGAIELAAHAVEDRQPPERREG